MSETQTMCLLNLKYICRCCHSDGNFYSLKEPYKFKGKEEVYNRMLIETFGILISPPTIEASYTICNYCIIRLRDSTAFRNQVEACEEKFSQYSQILVESVVANGDDVETMVEFKKDPFKDLDCETKIVNDDVEIEGDAIKNENVTATDTEDGLSVGDEVQDLDVKDIELNSVEYENRNIELRNVDENKDIRIKNLVDDLNNSEITVDPPKSHLTESETKNENMICCVLCPKKFISKDLLKVHIKEHKTKKYKCNHCGNSFVGITGLKKHSRTIHNKLISFDKDTYTGKDKNGGQNSKLVNYLECRFCKKQVQEYTYERHLKSHVGKTECINCGEIFDSTDLLNEHSKKHKYENMYTCDYCKKRFIFGRATLRKHIEIHHMGKDRKFMCHECGGFFNDITNLRAHITTVHLKLRKFECSVCQKKLSSKKTLKQHMRSHTGERPYVCDGCGCKFTNITSLKKHKIKHDTVRNDDSKYVCKICQTTFLGQGRLTYHIRSKHPGSSLINTNWCKKKYLPCISCNKVFAHKYSLHRHMQTHEVIDKVSCKFCNKMLGNKGSLYRHIRNIHNSKERMIKEKVQCSLCKRKVRDIKNHMTVHRIRPMKCETCGKDYTDAPNLHRHIRNVHQAVDKIFQCKKCDHAPFSKSKTLRNHMLKKHGCDLKAE